MNIPDQAYNTSYSTSDLTEPAFSISDLCEMLKSYLEPDQIAEIERAYFFGAEAHEGQHRLSGESYINHPLAVA